jgi:Tfp pilus assembly protein PilO
MTISDRDKKIVMILVPIMLLAGYWFLVLTPKREQAAALEATLTQVESERDQAELLVSDAQRTKGNYASDYATVVRLGKAIPSEVDLPSLIVQLDEAASDTDIRFVKVATGERDAAAVAPAPPAAGTAPPASEAGGAPATTAPGTAVETANEGAAEANADAGGAPAAPGAAPASGVPSATAPALESVPLDFSFEGSFFELADFFHEMKRFVQLANSDVRVNGRLMTIDGLSFTSEAFPTITAEVQATAYLSPAAQGTSAGATPAGPSATPAAATPPTAPAPAPGTEAAVPATDAGAAQ